MRSRNHQRRKDQFGSWLRVAPYGMSGYRRKGISVGGDRRQNSGSEDSGGRSEIQKGSPAPKGKSIQKSAMDNPWVTNPTYLETKTSLS